MMGKLIKRVGGASNQRLYLAVGLLLFAAMGCAEPRKIVCFWQSFTPTDLAGTYVGFSPAGGYYAWRIQLLEKGGFIARSWWTNVPSVYRIDSWQIRGGAVIINHSPVSSNAPPFSIVGFVDGLDGITFDIAEPGTGWSRSVVFYRESEMEGHILKLKQAMENLK